MNVLPLLGIWTPGPMELAVIAVIALLIFGRRLPEIMRGLGGSVREFRKGLDEGTPENKESEKKDRPEGTAARDEHEDADKPAEEGESAPAPRDDERRL